MRSITNCVRTASLSGIVVVALSWSFPGAVEAQRSASMLYKDAQSAEKRLHQSTSSIAKKSVWTSVAKLYRKVVINHPRSGYSDDALYYEAEIYLEIFRRFDDRAALIRALDSYLLLANGYPASRWARKARLSRGKLFLESLSDRKSASIALRKVVSLWPNASEAAEARRLLDNLSRPKPAASESFPKGVVGVRHIRHWSDSKREYTRVVIDLDKDVKYRQGQLENPDRIYFDLIGTRVTKALASKSFPVEGDFLKQIRVGQNKPGVVRVVLDFKRISEYNVFWLPDPYRLVVDISGRKPRPKTLVAEMTPRPAPPPRTTPTPRTTPMPGAEDTAALKLPPAPTREGFSTARQLGLSVGRVLIDPGHGGRDPGTQSKKLQEKHLVLDISKRVAKLLEKDNFEVMMTRRSDVFIPLEERTAIANSKGADLFVSIHVNASRNSRPRGTETYFLNLTNDPAAAEVAARENATTTRRLSELNDLLQKVLNNSKITESRELATHVQNSMAGDLFSSPRDSRNRGVKKAPFYVLLGAQMPAVLVEVAYLSNRKDEALLASVAYRQKIAKSIAKGIRSYHETLGRTTTVTASGARIVAPQ
jgi:N-acetylmuramoyl-L-alanine amidase